MPIGPGLPANGAQTGNDSGPEQAPTVFISYAHDTAEHKYAVLMLAELLVDNGIDAMFDQWADVDRKEWGSWSLGHINKSDFVIIVASPNYRWVGDGLIATKISPGVQSEAAVIRDQLHHDRPAWTRKLLPVVLPGHSIDEIPTFLQPFSADHYVISELTNAGIDGLRRALTGQPNRVRPPLGTMPSLPPLPPALPHSSAIAEQDGLFRSAVPSADLSQVLVEAAQSLVGAVADLWRGESRRLGLDDPRPLVTRWRADSGEFDRVGSFFRQDVPTRRLVVLGRPGSGKSVLAIRLVSDLLDVWTKDDPVPVLVPVTDWHPGELPAFDWLARRLARDHRLGRTVRWVDGKPVTLAFALVEAGMVLPVLDGLETIAEDLRSEAIAALNRLGSSIPLIVTCGLVEYRELEAAGIGLARASQAELLPLDRDDVEDYLAETVPNGKSRLVPLFARLRAEPVPTPLVVWLVRVVHQELGRDPGDLCDRVRFPDLDSIEAHLMKHLVRGVYPDYPGRRSHRAFARVHHSSVQRWLEHLASTGTADIAWWQLNRSLPWVAPACRVLAGAALGFGLFSTHGVVPGLVAAAVVGLVANNTRYLAYFNVPDIETPRAFDGSMPKVRAELHDSTKQIGSFLLLLVGILALSIAGYCIVTGLVLSLRAALTLTTLVLGGGFLVWWFGRKLWHRSRHGRSDGLVVLADLKRPTSPGGTLRADRKVALVGAGPMLALAAVFAVWGADPAVRIALGFAAAWMFFSAYARFTVARLVLAARGKLPWRLFGFLDDARDRGVLRQYGAVYQFRHQHLQRHLGGPA